MSKCIDCEHCRFIFEPQGIERESDHFNYVAICLSPVSTGGDNFYIDKVMEHDTTMFNEISVSQVFLVDSNFCSGFKKEAPAYIKLWERKITKTL